MSDAVFLTDATGFLGTEVSAELLRTTDDVVYALVRAADPAAAAARLKAVWWEIPELAQAIGSRVVPVCGDMTQPGLGLSDADRSRLASVSHVIHAAAETGIQHSKEHLWRINVTGTQNVLSFAETLPHLSRFVHISTAYVAGQRKGLIREDDPLPADANQGNVNRLHASILSTVISGSISCRPTSMPCLRVSIANGQLPQCPTSFKYTTLPSIFTSSRSPPSACSPARSSSSFALIFSSI